MPVQRSARARQVEAVRRFSRFYTRRIGVLREGLLHGEFPLAQARVLWELAHRERATASDLAHALGLDAGYLSRLLRALARAGLVSRRPNPADRRQGLLALTRAGRGAFARLDRQARREVDAMIAPLAAGARARLVRAMAEIEALIEPGAAAAPGYRLRRHRPGDIGWVVHRHGALYAQEYGWDDTFEAMVAEIAARFVRRHRPECERCWIAEGDEGVVGSVFLVRLSKTTAQLRLLYVEPHARGAGLGRRLVDECARFAREAGYRRIRLWTNDVLLAAREIYRRAGYRLVASEPYRGFGHDLVGETWELDL